MQNSVQLNQLPYTGFDYGLVPNLLFWLVLLVWSIVISRVILRNTDAIAKVFASLAKVFIGRARTALPRHKVQAQPQVQTKLEPTYIQAEEGNTTLVPEPVILSERIIKEPVMPIEPVAIPELQELGEQQSTEQSGVQEATAFIDIDDDIKSKAQAARERVRAMVAQELQSTRVGQAPGEFSGDDFAVVDFDGVNPDDNWQPRVVQRQAVAATQRLGQMREYVQESASLPSVPVFDSSVLAQVAAPEPLVAVSPINTKQYKDTMQLDASGEYPKIDLKREEVA